MQKIKNNRESLIPLSANGLTFTFMQTGDLFEISKEGMMLNQVNGNPIDGSMNNVYLRLYTKNGKIIYHPMVGIHSGSAFFVGEKQAKWAGTFEGVDYTVFFALSEQNSWFWKVELSGQGREVDVIYGQDIGLAEKGTIQSNEAYVAQYVDHNVFEDDRRGFVVCSRQNQPQGEKFPYLQQGSLTKAVGFSTDGFQFFKPSYKTKNEPEVLTKAQLANEIYQYEFDYTALQSEKTVLEGTKEVLFYSFYKESHPEEIISLEFQKTILQSWKEIKEEEKMRPVQAYQIKETIGEPLAGKSLTEEKINQLYPKRLQEEYSEDKLLSFFTPAYEHVVLKEKEEQLERPHGQILFTGHHLTVNENVMSTTSWMYGIFNAQLVLGNTNMNKWLTNARNPLNIQKVSGQRIYVALNGHYRLLTMPSLFEIGFNFAKWVYETDEDTFTVINYTSSDQAAVHLIVEALSKKKYRFFVTNQVVLNNEEYQTAIQVKQDGNMLAFSADKTASVAFHYPALVYHLKIKGTSMALTDETAFIKGIDPGSASMAVLALDETDRFELIIQGSLNGESFQEKEETLKTEKAAFKQFFEETMNHFNLSLPNRSDAFLEKLNIITWWYTQNMFVHYLVPHGLEQYGGAAWGTRDVSQGPAEYFMAMQEFSSVRAILKTLYSHQHIENGNWPQWFMFDKYSAMQADESHGDIIVWPLKLLGDYLTATNDNSLLEEKVPYMKGMTGEFTKEKYTLFDHVEKEIAYIQAHFLPGTFLSSYGDGDWDDTLQPNDAALKKRMASSWTIELTYQTLKQFEKGIAVSYPKVAHEAQQLAEAIKKDYQKYILTDEVVPGFIRMEGKDKVEKVIHPEDQVTGIQYRLLPMIRGMISELFTEQQTEQHYQLIKKELQFPDGVRLMNRPAAYHGGVSRNFKRAEQSANFGREIGLQYVHAHIRFLEAMAKIGKADEIWKGLEVINPINIQTAVPTAMRRQSNAYFSSSDGAFKTRYAAQENFDRLKTQEVPVKGGWRIYSSGPGIYLSQLIMNVLGIKIDKEELFIDPVLSKEADGICFDFSYGDYPIQYVYHVSNEVRNEVQINGQLVKGKRQNHPYRQGGLLLKKEDVLQVLNEKQNIMHIFFKENK
ncbi:GH36-type glycosyl hydrolase domain-containing protein [Pisciglobus halotolerans]|uniref:Putative lysine transport system substrate-binding protein n=1 Tax=Pisciglobus halotolerans TaxID=745365 RepID=A0A1I3AV04_9LACT|nr:cellobiose phosphorylase [Pisciglobus halotolerans]SFH53780.1 putative lysine transport system substrate-binding protein [Pisciglobus halotolerans]